MLKNKIMKKIGAGFIAGLCAFSMLGTGMNGAIQSHAESVSATENEIFPSADEVIAQAATLLGAPYGFGFKGYTGVYYQGGYSPLTEEYIRQQGLDCSGLIYYTMTQLGYKTSGFSWNNPVPVDTPHWLSVNENCTISYGGVTSKIDVEKNGIKTEDKPYWECPDGSTIAPGSVVIADNLAGEDHSWIYMGEFDSRDEVVKYLRNIGVNESYINSSTVGSGNGDGGTHWRIESNGSQGVVINNNTDGKKATAMNMSAFRITKTEAEFTITKVLNSDNSVKISGTSPIDGTQAIYGVYTDSDCTQKIGEITIGDDGTGSITLPDKQYYVREISAPTGYDLSTDVVAELVTDKNGYAETDLLYLGKYEIMEVSAPYGYVKNPEIQAIELTYAGQEVTVRDTMNTSFVNDYQGIEISLEKFMENDEKYGISTENSYKNVRFGLFADEEIIAADGTSIPENGLIAEVSLGEDMKAVFAEKLPFSRYYVQEIATDEHYVLNGEKYLVNFEYMGQEMTTVYVNGVQFDNLLKRGTVKGIKVNESEEPLENALFGLFNTDCTEFTAENAIVTAKSDKQGKFEFAEVVYGEYIVREIAVPDGYVLSDKKYPVTISEDGEIVEITAINKPVTVEISKRDVHGNELEGAEMELVNSDGEVVKKWTSDGTNHVISGLSAGKYVLKEVAAPDGYVIATDIEFTVYTDGTIKVENVDSTAISADGNPMIVMVDEAEKIPEKTPEIPNIPVTPSIPTGDAGRSPLGYVMIAAGLIGLACIFITKRKERN